MVQAVGIERLDSMQSFRHLAVPLPHLGPKHPACGKDRIGTIETKVALIACRMQFQQFFLFQSKQHKLLRRVVDSLLLEEGAQSSSRRFTAAPIPSECELMASSACLVPGFMNMIGAKFPDR